MPIIDDDDDLTYDAATGLYRRYREKAMNRTKRNVDQKCWVYHGDLGGKYEVDEGRK